MNVQILVAIMDSRVAWHPYEYLDIWIIMLYLTSYRIYYVHNKFPNIIIPEVSCWVLEKNEWVLGSTNFGSPYDLKGTCIFELS